METGLYAGGTASMMVISLLSFDRCKRQFWGFDSFEGLPDPSLKDEVGEAMKGRKGKYKIFENETISNMKAVGAWEDGRVHLVKGWFNDTCKLAPIEHIVFLRLDGDLYESTLAPLRSFYDKVVPGKYHLLSGAALCIIYMAS